jgi:hypothetical protein
MIPVSIVNNKFLVLTATSMHGRAASKAVLSNDKDKLPSTINRLGRSRADNTAIGICFNHRITSGGKLSRDNTTRGRSLGSWVTILIPMIINAISDLISPTTLLT